MRGIELRNIKKDTKHTTESYGIRPEAKEFPMVSKAAVVGDYLLLEVGRKRKIAWGRL